MTQVDQFFSATHDVQRDQYGRRMLDIDGSGRKVGVTSVTTLSKTLEDQYHLEQWKLRTVVRGLGMRPDLVQLAAVTPLEDKSTLNEIIETAAVVAGSGVKAYTGTALHTAIALAVSGADAATIPTEFHPVLRMLFAELARNHITLLSEYNERRCVCTQLRINGQFDFLARLGDGRLVVVDLKSGRIDMGALSIAVQLASYAHADVLYDADGRPGPMPGVDQTIGLIIQVRIDGDQPSVAIEEFDLVAGWSAAVLATTVRAYRRRDDLYKPYIPGLTQSIQVGNPHGFTAPAPTPVAQPTITPEASQPVVAPEQGFAVQQPVNIVPVTTDFPPAPPMPVAPTSIVPEFVMEQPAEPVPAATDETGINEAADNLYVALRKRKADAQGLARKVMAGSTTPIKLTQYGVNICKDILRHPNWPTFEPKPTLDAPTSEQPTEVAPPPVPAPIDNLSPEARQIQANVQAIQDGNLASVSPIRPPVATPEAQTLAPVAQSPLDDLVNRIRQSMSKADLSRVWQIATSPGGPGWTGQLDAESKVRLTQLGIKYSRNRG